MAEFDLSFADVRTSEGSKDYWDDSFYDMSNSDQVALGEQQRSTGEGQSGGSPYPQRPKEGFWNSMRSAITGYDRETRASNELPSLADVGIKDFFGDDRNIPASALAQVLTFSPEEQVKILSSEYPEMRVASDEAGNVILGYQGKAVILNKPGFSRDDAIRTGATAAAFAYAAPRAGLGILANAARVGGRSAGVQTGIEALQASSGGEINPSEIALAGTTGAVTQGALQALAPLGKRIADTFRGGEVRITDSMREAFRKEAVSLGLSPDEVTDDVIANVVQQTGRSGTPREQAGAALEREFDIPMTRGERSLDSAQLFEEDMIRQGVRGDKGQAALEGFQATQRDQATTALDGLQGRIGRGTNPDDAGGIVNQSVRDAEQIADEAVSEGYAAVGPAQLNRDGMVGTLRAIKQRITRDVGFDPKLPQTANILGQADEALRVFRQAEGVGAALKPTDIKMLENYRRRINTAVSAAEGSDKAQVMAVKRVWDEQIDAAVDGALFSGDDGAIESLKAARGIFREYAKKFYTQPTKGKSGVTTDTDPAGKMVERIISADPTPGETINFILGASALTNPKNGIAMYRRVVDILGPESEAVSSIRAAALKRMIGMTRENGEDFISGTKTLTNIDKALKTSPDLMREMFSPDEIAQIRRFGAAVQRTQATPPKSRANASGSGVTGAKLARGLFQSLDLGALFDPMAMVGATAGRFVMRGQGRANEVMRPFSQLATGNAPAVRGAAQTIEGDDVSAAADSLISRYTDWKSQGQ